MSATFDLCLEILGAQARRAGVGAGALVRPRSAEVMPIAAGREEIIGRDWFGRECAMIILAADGSHYGQARIRGGWLTWQGESAWVESDRGVGRRPPRGPAAA